MSLSTRSFSSQTGENTVVAPALSAELAAEQLADFIHRHPRLTVLTGAGVSTDSGIPDYRDRNGLWKRKPPVDHRDFMKCAATRQRYWGRALIGWPLIRNSAPNPAHFHLAELERRGHINLLITQNVDRLHQRAGSERVIDLHGRADEIRCMDCDYRAMRQLVHDRSYDLNPGFRHYTAETAPDGDADLEVDFSSFQVADCPNCAGILKPDVVFFGDNVPAERVQLAMENLRESDGLLVVGSSLMVYSGFRFCRYAREWGKPIVALTLGCTRADNLLDLKLDAPIGATLAETIVQLSAAQDDMHSDNSTPSS
ncbi:NAD-dependent protein deacetylase [Microbulbifer hydrolyticus]|uniref:protein acetyllysine N-acetyltransferase n=1 Tax=Microbulbifer hydrolyticus TaxID=48074 RepID=A0A6P1TAN4_9GAMM|nr:NAD-dependent protein deacetylase [Microbulbifer hydrolyticus]MBB5212871.1 NAD-dependent SIR2 family protein deacetylase [Microbulbifer hydrolyticus]QHQ38339.1 NAD-dependent protein deacetylase [Microbulbifer hydrolyticus]